MYPPEILDSDDDNGTIVENVDTLAAEVIGLRIVKVERDVHIPQDVREDHYLRHEVGTEITLSDGKRVFLVDSDDCCAYTSLEGFFLNPESVDHVILGVGTTGGYRKWHIYADFGDMLALDVNWSPGNPFYYAYGFDIVIVDPEFAPVTPEEEAAALRSITEGKT